MIHRTGNDRSSQAGHATVETIVALLALAPFLIGIPLLGKQLDVKHKSYDATRYSVWERTVYRSDGAQKSAADIGIETRDRALGNARAGISNNGDVRRAGVSENVLWRDRANQRLLVARNGNGPQPVTYNGTSRESPVGVGAITVPQIAFGANAVGNAAMTAVGVRPLGFDRNSFARADISLRVRPLLGELADRPIALRRGRTQSNRQPVMQAAAGGILSDTWSPRSETDLRNRIDNLVANERVWQAEFAGMALGWLGGKGTPLYGEGQYGFGRGYLDGPDLTVPSTSLPSNYVYTPR
ncbi:MAG: hypothetical protein ABW171_08440 [Steroidobacter sp.]